MTLTRFQLKILAICSMFLDHAMKIFEDVLEPAMGQTLYTAVLSLGRMAFLIFAFQLAEGVWHTHNVKAYLKRLFGFALLAEIPFQMVKSLILTGEITLSFGLTNVMMTLFLGVLSCVAYAFSAQKDRRDMGKFAVFVIGAAGGDYGDGLRRLWRGVCFCTLVYMAFTSAVACHVLDDTFLLRPLDSSGAFVLGDYVRGCF